MYCIAKRMQLVCNEQPTIRQLLEQYEMAGRDPYTVFVDLEKTFDRVPREVI